MATNKAIAVGIVGVGLVVLFGYLAYVNVDVKTQPDIEIAASARLSEPAIGMGRFEYVTPANAQGPVVTLPHRYPTLTGCNITTLINHGFEPLRKSAPSDSRWIEQPPGDVMF